MLMACIVRIPIALLRFQNFTFVKPFGKVSMILIITDFGKIAGVSHFSNLKQVYPKTERALDLREIHPQLSSCSDFIHKKASLNGFLVYNSRPGNRMICF